MKDVSIITPVYNDPDGVRDTLQSLLKLDYSSDKHEIIVVDNGSTDSTRSVAENLTEDNDHAHVLVEDDIQSSYAARNKGIKHANGRILAFIDSDMSVETTWLTDLVEFFKNSNADYVGCDVEVYLPDGKETLIGRYSVAEEFPVELYVNEANFAPTCCLAVRKVVIDEVGDFTSDLVSGGDTEFGQRVANAGYTQRFAENITIYHPARTSFEEHIRKAIRQGRGREQRYQQRGKSVDSRAWYIPRNFLPPNPFWFRTRVRGECGMLLFLIFYNFRYVFKLAKAAGQTHERFFFND